MRLEIPGLTGQKLANRRQKLRLEVTKIESAWRKRAIEQLLKDDAVVAVLVVSFAAGFSEPLVLNLLQSPEKPGSVAADKPSEPKPNAEAPQPISPVGPAT